MSQARGALAIADAPVYALRFLKQMTLNYYWEKLLRITHQMLAIVNNYQNKSQQPLKNSVSLRNF
jgi:hypothetical protein